MKLVIDIPEEVYKCVMDGTWCGSLYEELKNGVPFAETERSTGKWIWNKRTGDYECSECGCNPIYERTTPDVSEIDKYRYCRWCGADMSGKQTLKYADNDTALGGLQSAT